ncbi:hypothetical protein B0T24DRAFT_506090, partial [Lasiosphaeria ovina]
MALSAVFVFLGLAHGHMIMNRPVPFNLGNVSLSPLSAPGGKLPYPCQGLTSFDYRTPVVAGQTTLVNFTGTMPHGGGSCQFGINFHGEPYTTNPADWKTIYTIIGGCPAEVTTASGNLNTTGVDFAGRNESVHCGDDKVVNCIRQFNIPFPVDLPNGNHTFAFTWFRKNTAGEMYMNCAPISIIGGASSPANASAFVDGLPSMFLANIKGFTNCTTNTTGEHGVFNIPNPGRYGVQLIEPDPAAAGSCPVAPPAP